ncbi:hypothetical protein [Mesorhizobium sp.]|uniref:hypothetical protein n=1 Tax=Mesorhizobium sp. TaxID=1871066 RepID=UPI000FE3E4F3|nr:hypothetical protein [Mesorhizobium sp.]RWQ16098.1 MAG: hypothetical protein EOR92_22750 [Mesorhizobium sp.]
MPKVRFLEDRIVKDGTGTKFEAGKVYEMSQGSCDHWIARGVAVSVSSRAAASETQTVSATGEVIGPRAAEIAAKQNADDEAETAANKKAAEDAAAKAKADEEAKDDADAAKKKLDDEAKAAADKKAAEDAEEAKSKLVATHGGVSSGKMGRPRA